MRRTLFLCTVLSLFLFTNKMFSQADIVGGEDADIQDYPYQAALISTGGWFSSAYCGASIINEYWILTAAHCVQGESANNTGVRVGNSNSYAQGGETYDAAQIIIHENYNSVSNGSDIALIRLEDPIIYNNFTQPVLVVCDQQVDLGVEDPGETSWITGWGNDEGTANNPDQLQVVGEPITTQSNYGNISSDMIMAGYPNGGYDSCQGDSGGPMVVLAADGETYLQVGVVSWGNGCAEPGYPGVYARVSYFIDWICENTGGAVCANQNPFCDGDAVYGCTDSDAENYNSDATINDGSCQYSCDNAVVLDLQLDCYGEEISWEIINNSGTVVASVSAGTYPGAPGAANMVEGGSVQQEEVCLSEGCYTFIISDTYGDGLDGGAEVACVEAGFDWTNLIPFSMVNEDGELLFQENDPAFGDCESGGNGGICSGSYEFCVTQGAPIYGCTDSDADNYNPEANTNDGSCEYLGCTDVDYMEYDPEANVNDGSCETLIIEGCMDSTAENFDSNANIDDGSCEYLEGCTDSNADNYNPDAVINDGSCEYTYSWSPCNDQIWLENFESYDDTNIDSESSEWFGWENSNSGVDVTDDFAFLSNQSILVEQDDDLVHEFSDIDSGSGELIFYIYIPSSGNAGAYYNILHDYDGNESNWAFQVFFTSQISGDQSYLDLDQPVYFDALYDTWVQVRNEIDIDNNSITLYYNNNMIANWDWSDGSAGESSVLGALNLFGACAGSGCVGQAWYDNIELCGFNSNTTDISEQNVIESIIYPNPNNGFFELTLSDNLSNVTIEITDILGKKVYSDLIENYSLDNKHAINFNQPVGTYIMRVISDNFNDEKLLIIK